MQVTVALSRVRGLKRQVPGEPSPCHGRTLTSAWIETGGTMMTGESCCVALSRVRGLKPYLKLWQSSSEESHSHECVD